MAQELKDLYNNLLEIRRYLVKIGPSRRKGNVIIAKLEETDKLIRHYNECLNKIGYLKGSVKEKEFLIIEQICLDFDKLYEEILNLCSEDSSQRPILSGKSILQDTNMAKFDLKTALNLLPVSKDDESSMLQLIDGIEYYKSELDQESQSKLVKFVLKSRLSRAAKLKLSTSYNDVDALLKDMKNQLLPKKSAAAIQRKLLNIRQNDLSIDEYGKQISEMFVDLTVSQANGNDSNYKILHPLNEKQAIKSFADGLRNRRLSTIIAARNLSSLQDAIQAAVDEEVLQPSTSSDVMTINSFDNNTYFRNFRGRVKRFRGRRGFRKYENQSRVPEQQTDSREYGAPQEVRWQQNGWRGTRSFYRGRGKSNFDQFRNQEIRNIHTLPEPDEQPETETVNQNQFFRD